MAEHRRLITCPLKNSHRRARPASPRRCPCPRTSGAQTENRKIDWDEAIINQLIKKTGYKESTEFYKAIAEERLDPNALIERYQELAKREQGLAERAATRSAGEFTMEKEKDQTTASSDDVLIIDRNLKGIDFQMARCCNPVYGDDVFGFVTVNGGIKIHRTNCPNAPALRQRFGYRIVPAKWAGKGDSKYPITLHVVGNDDLGIVNNITSIISKEEKSCSEASASTQTTDFSLAH